MLPPSRLILIPWQELDRQVIQPIRLQRLVPKTTHALDIMATIEIMATEFFGPSGCKVGDGIAAELRAVLEEVPNLLLDLERRAP